jgi:hypothetical protein
MSVPRHSMPGASGVLWLSLEPAQFPTAIVFVTAYSEHAADSLDVCGGLSGQTVETDRLLQAISKVKASCLCICQGHSIRAHTGGEELQELLVDTDRSTTSWRG